MSIQILLPEQMRDEGILLRTLDHTTLIRVFSPTTPIYVDVERVGEPATFCVTTWALGDHLAQPLTDDELIDFEEVEGSPATLRTIRQALQID